MSNVKNILWLSFLPFLISQKSFPPITLFFQNLGAENESLRVMHVWINKSVIRNTSLVLFSEKDGIKRIASPKQQRWPISSYSPSYLYFRISEVF